MKEFNNRVLLWCAIFACLTGVFLRVNSFIWNKSLNGDVNLFALSARQLALYDQLDYPMKYEYSNQVAYLTLHTPASQHPPLWPVLAGVISKWTACDDTFVILKVLSEITGLLLICAIAFNGYKFTDIHATRIDLSTPKIMIIAISLASFSAILIDFSANGSPYILMALWLILSSCLLMHFKPHKFSHQAYAGLLCAASILTHMALLFLPAVFLYATLTQKPFNPQKILSFPTTPGRWLQTVVFILALLLGLSPWLIWNFQHFGMFFHSNSGIYFFDQLGLLHTGIYGNTITSQLDRTLPVAQILQRYSLMAGKSVYALSREFSLLVGPFGLFLAIVGLYRGMKTNKANMIALLFPTTAYSIVIVLWVTYKFRFLTPLLPAFILLATLGFINLYNSSKIWRWVAGLCLVGTLAWFIFPLFRQTKTLYYGRENQPHDTLYREMQPLAASLVNRQPGVVLGYAQYLDGGIETVYWHRFPFVAGRGLGETAIKKLVDDFDIRYIWTDTTTIASLQEWFPIAGVMDRSEHFLILELTD